MKKLTILIFLLLLEPVLIFAQSDGDYKTKNSGDWDDVSNWQIYDALFFQYVDASDYPDDNNSSDIIISSNNIITIPETLDLTNITGPIEGESGAMIIIDGSLNMSGAGWISGGSPSTYFPNLTINGSLSSSTIVNCTNFIINSSGIFETSFSISTAQTEGWWFQSYSPSTSGSLLDGNVIFSGTSQNIPTNIPFTDLEISSSGTTISGNLEVSGTLTINSDGDLTISDSTSCDFNNLIITPATGGLTVKSSSSSTGSIIVDGSISGSGASSVVFERYITGSRWHIIGSPLSGYAIQDFLSDNSIPINGSDYAMTDYTEGYGNGWNSFYTSATTGNMISGKGYLSGLSTSGVLSFTGDIPTSDVSFTLAFSDSGWNCLANPYPASLGATSSATTTQNFLTYNAAVLDDNYEAIYVWVEDGAYDRTQNYYVPINHATGSDTAYLQPGQGFLVRAIQNNDIASFTQAMADHQDQEFFKKSASGENAARYKLKISADNEKFNSSTTIMFMDGVTAGLDPGYDAGLFSSTDSFNIYTRLPEGSNRNFMLQCLPDGEYSKWSIPLGIDFLEGGVLTFSVSEQNLPDECLVILEDSELGAYTDLKQEDGKYTITLEENTSIADRFYLHSFDPRTVNINRNFLDNITIFAAEKEIFINGELDRDGNLTVYDLSGRMMLNCQLTEGIQSSIPVPELKDGIYVVYLVSDGKEKISKLMLH